jgi:hypothetical protein
MTHEMSDVINSREDRGFTDDNQSFRGLIISRHASV